MTDGTGRTVLVTGATAGIGRATAHALADRGATVLITGRDPSRGATAERELRAATDSERVHFLRADHSLAAGNHSLAEQVAATVPALDVLVDNVGGLLPGRQVSGDGVELTLALNLLAPVVLTTALRPLLAAGTAPRVVCIGSDACFRFRGDPFADPPPGGDAPFDAYARAKLLLLLACLGLERELSGDGVAVCAVNPGAAWTPGTQALTPDAVPGGRLMWPLVRAVQRRRSPERAAEAVVGACTAEPPVTGAYLTASGRVRRLGVRELDTAAQDRALRLARDLARAG